MILAIGLAMTRHGNAMAPGTGPIVVCVDCGPRPRPRSAPYPGPRCATHHRERRKLVKARTHDRRVTQVYRGVAPGDYQKIWEHQGEHCPICLRTLHTSRKRPPLDHHHKLDWPRGIPCTNCNVFIGWIHDDPEAGKRLFEYLTNPPAWHVVGPPPELAPRPFEKEDL